MKTQLVKYEDGFRIRKRSIFWQWKYKSVNSEYWWSDKEAVVLYCTFSSLKAAEEKFERIFEEPEIIREK